MCARSSQLLSVLGCGVEQVSVYGRGGGVDQLCDMAMQLVFVR